MPLWVSCETAEMATAWAAEPPRDLKSGRAVAVQRGERRRPGLCGGGASVRKAFINAVL